MFFVSGSVKVDFTVEATSNDENAAEALANKTAKLKADLSSGGLALKVGDLNLTAPVQTVVEVDVSTTVNATFTVNFKIDGDLDSLNETEKAALKVALVDEIAKWSGLTSFKEQIVVKELKKGKHQKRFDLSPFSESRPITTHHGASLS
jgi:hypothetical protein